jgi:hypothetical protein
VLEQSAPAQVGSIRDALSQLQLAYVRIGGQPGAGGGPAQPPPRAEPAGSPSEPSDEPLMKPGEPGPAQRSGRLWVPRQ